MNNHNRNHFTELLPCACGRNNPMRVYCDATGLYAVKCACGNHTRGFTTIAGAGRSWNEMYKKSALSGANTQSGQPKEHYATSINNQNRNCQVDIERINGQGGAGHVSLPDMQHAV